MNLIQFLFQSSLLPFPSILLSHPFNSQLTLPPSSFSFLLSFSPSFLQPFLFSLQTFFLSFSSLPTLPYPFLFLSLSTPFLPSILIPSFSFNPSFSSLQSSVSLSFFPSPLPFNPSFSSLQSSVSPSFSLLLLPSQLQSFLPSTLPFLPSNFLSFLLIPSYPSLSFSIPFPFNSLPSLHPFLPFLPSQSFLPSILPHSFLVLPSFLPRSFLVLPSFLPHSFLILNPTPPTRERTLNLFVLCF